MKHKVVLHNIIYDSVDVESSANYATARREIELPFIPIAGLELLMGSNVSWARISRVIWIEKDNLFSCECDFDYSDTENYFKYRIANRIEDGWTVSEIFRKS